MNLAGNPAGVAYENAVIVTHEIICCCTFTFVKLPMTNRRIEAKSAMIIVVRSACIAPIASKIRSEFYHIPHIDHTIMSEIRPAVVPSINTVHPKCKPKYYYIPDIACTITVSITLPLMRAAP